MQFSVGDKVMHPQYGAGKITNIDHRELVEGFEHYYVIELLEPDSILYVPVRKTDDLGIRPVMSQTKVDRVFDTLQGLPHRLAKDYKKRQARLREKISTGRSIKLAEAVRDLAYRRHHDRLTKVDQRLYDRGEELLASEMALATDSSVMDVQEKIQAALHVTLARKAA